MKTVKNEKRYITRPLLDIIQATDYKRKDDLYCILDMIYRRQIYFKTTLQKQHGFIEIPRASFQKLIPNPNYIKEAIDYLIEGGLILRNDYFVYGIKAKAYKIKTEFLGAKMGVEITDKNINKRIKNVKLSKRKIRVKNLEFAKTKYFKTFKINFDGAHKSIMDNAVSEIRELCTRINFNISHDKALAIINCEGDYTKYRINILSRGGHQLHNILHRLMVHQQQIYAIKDGYLFFGRNKTNGRLDTNLTSLPSYLRKFLISDEKLYNLDIKNSQPYFLYTKLLNEVGIDEEELKQYGQLVTTGTLYEFLVKDFYGIDYDSLASEEKPRVRNKSKINLFRIFYSKVPSFIKIKKVFGSKFPTVLEYINQTNEKEHNTLSVQLQERESYTILDLVMVKLQSQGINPFTIHDSFVVTESELPKVKEVLVNTCIEIFGIAPKLHEDELFEAKEGIEDIDVLDESGYCDESFFQPISSFKSDLSHDTVVVESIVDKEIPHAEIEAVEAVKYNLDEVVNLYEVLPKLSFTIDDTMKIVSDVNHAKIEMLVLVNYIGKQNKEQKYNDYSGVRITSNTISKLKGMIAR